ncbi:glycosyltransferase family 4 protein [Marinobacter qingdaonensis]|uniref:Glycosyltransferase family 4 protein n=1 Tax=Marinobacter qingdaonensis TaxID=3108486 RepID=A0ABU5P194_9GAMM|nr:glycosyltransferase family 4 protein [Marinobacter sp. ASW11-75]MEA1081846.1 glycosyltransferase family 4 protein [Marinobacter sp. ASW11-75]
MLVLFHCESNPGYAASSHEHTFLEVAKTLTGDFRNIHYAYANLDRGMTPSLPSELTNVLHLDTRWSDPASLRQTEEYVRTQRITRLLGFDQPVSRPMYQALRRGGIRTFVSYWGAPMSSLNNGFKLLLKKLEVSARRYGPDHYIFQSAGMRDTAVNGRGIPYAKTSIVKTGIDTERYAPDEAKRFYAHDCFDIPRNRKIIVFSGHMERRKGVHVILQAAKVLTQELGHRDAHFLILGNRPGEQKLFEQYLQEPEVNNHITFGGYRTDVPDLLKSCSIGMIASVVWDSFPMSSLEMAATQLPLLVSDLPGLNEAVTPDTGMKFPVEDHVDAAQKLRLLLTDSNLLSNMGKQGRARVIENYSRKSQSEGIVSIFNSLELATEFAL